MRLQRLMTSAAVAALIAGGAVAQTVTTNDDPVVGTNQPAALEQAYTSIEQMTVGDVLGTIVYGIDGDRIGEIDYVIDHGGTLAGVIGIGGFLGLGEYTVAIPLEEFELREDGSSFLLGATKEELKAMNEFDETGAESLDRDLLIAELMPARSEGNTQEATVTTTETVPAHDDSKVVEADGESEVMVEGQDKEMAEVETETELEASDEEMAEVDAEADAETKVIEAEVVEAETETELEQAGEEVAADVESGLEKAGDEVAEAADEAGNALQNAGEEVAESAGEAVNAVENAGEEAVAEADAALDKAGGEVAEAGAEIEAEVESEMAETEGEVETAVETELAETERETELDNTVATAPVATEADDPVVEPRFASVDEMTVEDVVGMVAYDPQGGRIGEIDYVIATQKGAAAVIGIGGFLGLGEYTVALPMDEFHLSDDGTFFTLDTDKETLKSTPEFDESEIAGLPDDMPIAEIEAAAVQSGVKTQSETALSDDELEVEEKATE